MGDIIGKKIRLGMIGGGRDSFIGAVHRSAAWLDGLYALKAGAFSSKAEKAKASGRDLGIADDRNYGSWQEMIEQESQLPEDERIEAVVIVTPNHMHFPAARACIEAGFHVICDKPMVLNSEQAQQLIDLVEQRDVLFAVTYNYTGYPMVKQARALVQEGRLGTIRKVVVEYKQDWLAQNIETQGVKQAEWRTDPARSGIAGAVGDIGSHAEHLVASITGLEIEAICADITAFVPGRKLDDDASILVRYTSGARGVMIASQIMTGEENGLSVYVYGEKAGLEWHQENPNYLKLKPLHEPEQILKRGNAYLCGAAQGAARLPAGHPEAFIEAFGNIYKNFAQAVLARREKQPVDLSDWDVPSIYEGARGVRFIEKVIESGKSSTKWTAF